MRKLPLIRLLLMIACVLSLPSEAQDVESAVAPVADQAAPAKEVPTAFSVSSPAQRGAWQERLELGPGDVVNIELFEAPGTLRSGVTIGPDGRISYLQARDVVATGLTVDELRERLDSTLARYYRAPRTIVSPVGFSSKKYFVLGNVVQKGVFPLDRPVTVVEAVAQARGFVSDYQGGTVVRADLSRSFLIRDGDRVEVDFEQLFLNGELANNIALEPDDYLYFPPLDLQEVYVVGEVASPGVLPMESNLSLVRALAQRGGFSDRAYKERILVIRGSLNRPETFVVSANDILKARATDFKLEPRDIVYVHSRPWILAEELLELGIKSFIRGAVIQWTGDNVELVDEPFLR